MPIFFVGYALAVWACAARWRRAPTGCIAVAIGALGLLGLNYLHYKLEDWTDGTIYLPVLQSIMYPYTGLVAGVGLYIACLPRIHAYQCRYCHYDLRGLAADALLCPECGAPPTRAAPKSARRSGADRHDPTTPDVKPT